jgi:hypothetical protein
MAGGETTGGKYCNFAVKQEKLLENGGCKLQNARKLGN